MTMLQTDDVTAIVLSMGEPTLVACLDALRAQTRPPADIVLVKQVRGFHKAFNQGLAQVRTDYLLQCDADMLLDPDCIEILRAAMQPGFGVVAAHLDDALLGRIQAVKLFRTAALAGRGLPARLNTDEEGIYRMLDEGLRILFVERDSPRFGHEPSVLGRHCPDYDDPKVVYGRFHRLGRKLRLRGAHNGFRSRLRKLSNSAHAMADVAIVALCEGVCDDSPEIPHEPFAGSAMLETLLPFRGHRNPHSSIADAAKEPVRVSTGKPAGK
jgi:glycosyltransferase involved in cell wall biosynthesis